MSISSMTDYEYVKIVSTYTSMTNPEYRCSVCKNKYARLPEKQEKHQERKGCWGPANPIQRYTGQGSMSSYSNIDYFICQTRFSDGGTASLVNYLVDCKTDLDTPNKIVEMQQLVHNLDMERQEETVKIKKRISNGRVGKR